MTHPLNVRPATGEDVAPWLLLAKEVEPLFGPMPEIETHIRHNIERGTALVAEGPGGSFEGAALLSPDGRPHSINWLAVRSGSRRRGIGSALVAAIIARWNDDGPIEVVTFGADVAGGEAARALYAAHGFYCIEELDKGPEGGTRERWTRG